MAPTPLEDFEPSILPRLGQALWSWVLCTECLQGKACATLTCQGQRRDKLQRYFQFYKAVVAAYVDEAPASPRALDTHEDLFKAICTLKDQPDITRCEFWKIIFPRNHGGVTLDPDDQVHATTLVTRVLVMVESSALHQSSNRLEKGGFRIAWKRGCGLQQVPTRFVSDRKPSRTQLLGQRTLPRHQGRAQGDQVEEASRDHLSSHP